MRSGITGCPSTGPNVANAVIFSERPRLAFARTVGRDGRDPTKMKRLWALRYVVGVFLAISLMPVLFAWAAWHYPTYVGGGIVLLILLAVAHQPRVREERERTDKLVDAAFQEAYVRMLPPPVLVRSFSYGYPAFEVKFRSKAEMEAASSRNDTFRIAIGNIFKGYGPRSRPFNAEQAICFTYVGYLGELRVGSLNESSEPRQI